MVFEPAFKQDLSGFYLFVFVCFFNFKLKFIVFESYISQPNRHLGLDIYMLVVTCICRKIKMYTSP